jgi:hypothetical protein
MIDILLYYSYECSFHCQRKEKGDTIYIPEAHCQLEVLLTCGLVAAELGVEVGAESQEHCQEADQ